MSARLGGSVTYDSCDALAPNAGVDELPKAEPNVLAARALLACAFAARLLIVRGKREERGEGGEGGEEREGARGAAARVEAGTGIGIGIVGNAICGLPSTMTAPQRAVVGQLSL
jgi:hypothetical protein